MTQEIIKNNISDEQAKQVVSYLKKSTTAAQFQQLFKQINKVIRMVEEAFPEIKDVKSDETK